MEIEIEGEWISIETARELYKKGVNKAKEINESEEAIQKIE